MELLGVHQEEFKFEHVCALASPGSFEADWKMTCPFRYSAL